MKRNLKKTFMVTAAMALCVSLFAGCGRDKAQRKTGEETPYVGSTAGTLLLSVNPEIQVAYDEQGLVVELEGVNDDGKGMITGSVDYQGKACVEVVNELVKMICESGYLDQTVAGNPKNIVIKVERGSAYPSDTFLTDIADGISETVTTYGITSKTLTVSEDDYDDNGYIGLEKVKELALAQAGLAGGSFVEKAYELGDGVYELEFTVDGAEYQLEVDAVSGKVREADFENNADWRK